MGHSTLTRTMQLAEKFSETTLPGRICSTSHPCNTLIEDIRILVARLHDVEQSHNLRKSNTVADLFAREGQELPSRLRNS
ncbi:hypothetical protein AHAS_Ahas03G0095900 [Arachis hypogaea]